MWKFQQFADRWTTSEDELDEHVGEHTDHREDQQEGGEGANQLDQFASHREVVDLAQSVDQRQVEEEQLQSPFEHRTIGSVVEVAA